MTSLVLHQHWSQAGSGLRSVAKPVFDERQRRATRGARHIRHPFCIAGRGPLACLYAANKNRDREDMDLSRRGLIKSGSALSLAVAAAEAGLTTPAWAEDKFTIASTGGTWQDGVRAAFVEAPGLEAKFGKPVAYSGQIESVAVAKILAQPDNPPYSVSSHGDPEAILLADKGCLRSYDDSVTANYKNLYPAATQPPRAGLENWYGSVVMLVWGLTYNTKYAAKPVSYQDMWNPKYKGRVGVPAYGWYGMMFLHQINRMLGGTEADVSKGLAAMADLVRKNDAVMLENADQTMNAFEREDVVIAPFFNGRTLLLQKKGVPVDVVYPPASTTLGAGFVILKPTKFPDMANALVNACFTPEYQLIMARKLGYPPANKTAVLPPDMSAMKLDEKDLEQTIKLDWVTVNKGRGENLDKWNKQVLGS
jgi:putative spermidine/putrescine transport system substrate-binding protein